MYKVFPFNLFTIYFSSQPFGVTPSNALKNLELLVDATVDITQVTNILKEFPLDLSWKESMGTLPKDMNFAK